MENILLYWNKTLTVLQELGTVMQEGSYVTNQLYDTYIKHDWQLQGSCVLVVVFIVLCVLVNLQWNTYGNSIMGVDGSGLSSHEHVNTTFETFPDEDPLTFTKKNK